MKGLHNALYIYTISHPFTNEIVYVGATKNMSVRISRHISSTSKTSIGDWIKNLQEKFILPKVDILDECSIEDLFYFESYWINQIQQWGYKLLNKNKTGYNKKYIKKVSKNGFEYITKKRVRRSKKWSEKDVEIGNVFTIAHCKKQRQLLTSKFKNYCRKFGVVRFLKYEKSDEKYIATVVLEKQKVQHKFGFTKSGIPRYKALKGKVYKQYPPKKWKVTRYNFSEINIGDSVTVTKDKFISFLNSAGQYRKLNKVDKWFNYTHLENEVICTCVLKQDLKRNTKKWKRTI